MSSVSHTGPDALVTLKVTYEGTTRRAKMPLREMAPRVLEEQIRTFLHLPTDAKAIIERYSDSAAAYVLLDSQNIAVYKQLYRAAKAKSKLKLRVTLIGQTENAAPKPVSVEEEPEAASTTTAAPVAQKEPEATEEKDLPTTNDTASAHETTLPFRGPSLSKMYNSTLLKDAAKYISERQDLRKDFESRLSDLMERNVDLATDLAKHQSQRQSCLRQQPEAVVAPVIDPLSRLLHAPRATLTSPISISESSPAPGPSFAVCCNSCEDTIPDAHYHCSTCDDGDFDLCTSCVDRGITCYSNNHWLIKRGLVSGQIVASTTETIAPKPKAAPAAVKETAREAAPAAQETLATPALEEVPAATQVPFNPSGTRWTCLGSLRTCNSCVQELPDREFLHCMICEDFDLCQTCFGKDAHGHHPQHAFEPAVSGSHMADHIKVKLAPGRNQMHHAICDGCDKYITGIRHKCLDCPDWDYCGDCIPNAAFVHAEHRFAPIYDPLVDIQACVGPQSVHMGICCDGPLCSLGQSYPSYIRGTRYKCAVCHDLDFCANCEASPANEHNKTHPLIKFKTPVRHVSVTTTGEHQGGRQMPAMGDRKRTSSKVTETARASSRNSINAVQTVVDVKPVEPVAPVEPVKPVTPEPEVKTEKELSAPPATPTPSFREEDLRAVFLRDSVSDGTIMAPNHVFEQTWVLRNEGNVSWPAGCSVKYVGGDYMGHVDSAHPAGISELVSASESIVCYAPLAPGQEFSFTVLLRAPARAGKLISYWRLTTQDGYKFGHRLWCEIHVRPSASEIKPKTQAPIEERKEEEQSVSSSSTMIFPKLEKESPEASMYEETSAAVDEPVATNGFEDGTEEEDWDASEDGFMTDEEYDILDASDEEYLEEQQNRSLRK